MSRPVENHLFALLQFLVVTLPSVLAQPMLCCSLRLLRAPTCIVGKILSCHMCAQCGGRACCLATDMALCMYTGSCSYQRTRLYTRIALGKARAMDVVSGESSGNFGQLVLLYPLLFWLQALQANIGVSMMLRGYGALFSPEGWLVGVLPGSSRRSATWVGA